MQKEYKTLGQVASRINDLVRMYGPNTPIQIADARGYDPIRDIWCMEADDEYQTETIFIFGESAP